MKKELVKSLNDKLSNKYKDLCSQLGDLEYRKSKISEQIKNIQDEIEKLNVAQPVLSDLISSLEEPETKEEN